MQIIDLPDLQSGKARIRQIQLAAGSDPPNCAVQVGDDKNACSVRWLQLPDGQEMRRRDLPDRGGEPDAGLSADLAILAYVERGAHTDWLVIEQPARPALGRRYLHPWSADDAHDAAAAGRALTVRYLAIGFSRDDALVRTCDADHAFVGWSTADLFSAPAPTDPLAAPRHASLRTGDFIGVKTTCLKFGASNAEAVATGLAFEESQQPGFAAVGDASGGTYVMEQGGTPWVTLHSAPPALPVRAVAFNPWSTVTCVAAGNHVLVWDNVEPAEPTLLATAEGHEREVTALDFTPDGKTLATVSVDGTLRFWDFADQRILQQDEDTGEGVEERRTTVTQRSTQNLGLGELTAIAVSPDGSFCVVGTTIGRLAVIDLV